MSIAIQRFWGGRFYKSSRILFLTFFISIILFSLTSCNNIFENNDIAECPYTTYATMIGNYSLPQETIGTRTAMPSIPAGSTYHIKATATVGGVLKTVDGANAVVDITTGTYTVKMLDVNAEGIDWTVKIWIEDADDNEILSASKTLTLTNISPIYSYDFNLTVSAATSGTGKIGLTMTVPSTIKRVTATCSASGWTSASPSVSVNDTTVTISSNAIAAGSYTVQFDFWSSTSGGIILYSDTQVINVVDKMTTQSWINNGGSSEITNSGTYVLTTAMLDAFARTVIYVGTTTWGNAGSNNSGSPFAPLQTLTQAGTLISNINKPSAKYTIIVTGTLTGNQTLPAAVNSKASKITIKGYDTNAKIQGGSGGSGLEILTMVPVYISNLTITGGTGKTVSSYTYGGGLYITPQAVVHLVNNVIIAGNTAMFGGAIFLANQSSLFIYGNTVIGASSIARPTAASNASNSSTKSGGAIYTKDGRIYLGYSSCNNDTNFTPDQISEFTGGIYGNYSGDAGGGIFLSKNTGSPFLYINSGTISKNYAYTNGGGIYSSQTGTEISSATISNNASGDKGGAIYADSLTNFKFGPDISIPYGGSEKINDIFLNSSTITITGTLSNHSTSNYIMLKPQNYVTTGKAIEISSNPNPADTDLVAETKKFKVIDNDTSDALTWFVCPTGYFNYMINAADVNSYIVSLSSSQMLYLNGSLNNDIITGINGVLKTLHSNKPDVKVSLDLSATEGLTSFPNNSSDQTKGFYNCQNLENIVLPETITNLGKNTFNGCSSLTSIVIPDSVTSLNDNVFIHCTSLTSVTLPQNLTSIGAGTFNDCQALTEINFPDSLTSIGSSAFVKCYALEEVEFPDGLTTIGSSIFNNCTSLNRVVIPDSVQSIGTGAFYACNSLTEVNLPENPNYTEITSGLFRECSSLASITIPPNVTTIGSSAFDLAGLSGGLVIPDTVTKIEQNAFMDCDSLTSVTLHDHFELIGQNLFMNCDGIESVTIKGDFAAPTNSDGICVFQGCLSLRNITIEPGVTKIFSSTFRYCTSLQSVNIPDSVTVIGNGAFDGCTALTSASIPPYCTFIEAFAFRNCNLSTTITIPATVTKIGKSAFEGNSNITGLAFSDTSTIWWSTSNMEYTGGSQFGTFSTNIGTNKNTLITNSTTAGKYYYVP